MGRLTFGLLFEALGGLVTVLLLGNFLGDHVAELKFAIPAAFLDVLAIGFMINLILQIAVARQIDYGRPIAAIQKKLEELRVLRIRYVQGLLIVAVLAWPPLLVVAFAALGVDAYALFGAAYIWANVLVGLAVIPLAIWAARKIGDRAGGSPVVRYLVRTIGGSSLNAAGDFLATLSEFEREPLATD
jgi:hypothetical protein